MKLLYIILICIFALGYLFITLEHSLKIDKLIPALGMMALLWALISLSHLPVFEVNTALKELEPTHIDEVLLHHLGKTAEIGRNLSPSKVVFGYEGSPSGQPDSNGGSSDPQPAGGK